MTAIYLTIAGASLASTLGFVAGLWFRQPEVNDLHRQLNERYKTPQKPDNQGRFVPANRIGKFWRHMP